LFTAKLDWRRPHSGSSGVPCPNRLGELVVKIALSGINPIDYKIRRGRRPGDKAAFPEVVPHSDGAGTVEAVGSNVASGRPESS
jgi:NADPH:quinone reductase